MKDLERRGCDGTSYPSLDHVGFLCVYFVCTCVTLQPTYNVWYLVYGSENALKKERRKEEEEAFGKAFSIPSPVFGYSSLVMYFVPPAGR